MDMNDALPALISFRGLVGLGLILGCVGAALLIPLLPRMRRRTVAGIAIGGLAFQAFHLLEHLIQLFMWFLHPTAPPHMTPWALDGVDGIAAWFALLPGNATPMAGGMEGLHLVGNVIFLVGIVALGRVTPTPLPGVQTAFILQGIHVAEHVLLTATLWLFGTPMGLSTLFGVAYDFSWAGTGRVWFHFLINLGGTIPAATAAMLWWKQTHPTDAVVAETVVDSRDRDLLTTTTR